MAELPKVRGRITYRVVEAPHWLPDACWPLAMHAKAHGYRRDDGEVLQAMAPFTARIPEIEEHAKLMCREIMGAYLRDHPDCIANASSEREVKCDDCRLCYLT